MPWTDSRSRDEWLAEVRRRGTRIRRRRRAAFGAIGALALVLPVSVTATVLSGGTEGAVELSVAAPAPLGGLATPLPSPPNELATGDVPAAATTAVEAPAPITVTGVQEREAAINAVPEPRSSTTPVPTSVPPADDPVVARSTPAPKAPDGSASSPPAGGQLASSSAASAPSGPAALPPCIASEFGLTVTMERSAYGRGEMVKGGSVLEKRTAGPCVLPSWGIQISLRNGAGTNLTHTARTFLSSSTFEQDRQGLSTCDADGCRRVVDLGAVFTDTFEWETVDCTNVAPVRPVPPDDSNCVPFPAGTYTVVADWNGPGSGPPGRATFQLT